MEFCSNGLKRDAILWDVMAFGYRWVAEDFKTVYGARAYPVSEEIVLVHIFSANFGLKTQQI